MATLRTSTIAVLFVVSAIAMAGWIVVYSLTRPVTVTPDTRIVVNSGDSFAGVARRLADAGILGDPRPLIWFAKATGAAREIRSGEFSLARCRTGLDVLDVLREGKPITYQATLVEGWTLAQALRYLAELPALETTLGNIAQKDLMATLGLDPGPAEGWFLPETYQFERGTDDATLLRRAHAAMVRLLDQTWAQRDADLPYESPYELLVLASLVEKETGLNEDRGKIARVFVSRLQQGMRLQTDPTVIYGLGDQFDGNLTRAHLRTDGPYNTYRRAGLPPTPIALPGGDALRAAAHPEAVPYLYFVARGDGTSQFSATLDEHLAAVRRYQLNQK